MTWDCLLGLTTEFTEDTEVKKRGGDENQLMNALVSICLLCGLRVL